jgi:hypothetical protein
MKAIILLSALMLSSLAIAEVPSFVAREVTCAELQENLANYKVIAVVTRPLRIKTTTIARSEAGNCGIWEYPSKYVVGTKDIKNCRVGVTCVARTIDFSNF